MGFFSAGSRQWFLSDAEKLKRKRKAVMEVKMVMDQIGMPPVEKARFSKVDPYKWDDEKVNYVFQELKLIFKK